MFLEKDGKKLFYEVQGQGEPTLLFVHGWLASGEIWRAQVAEFSRRQRVVTFDLSGFGRSSKREGDYPFELFADDVDLVIDELRLDKPILIGWSMGASIGLVYAARQPEKLAKLVLVDGTPSLLQQPDFPQALPGEAAQDLGELMANDFPSGARAFVELMFPEPDSEALKEWVYSLTQQTTVNIALNSISLAGDRDLRPLLGQINLPTLVLHGEQDQICLLGAGRFMQENIPNAQIYIFPGKGHAPFLTDTAAFNERLAAFV